MQDKFLWGSATASYQCEGAWDEGGKGLSMWDVFSHESPLNINHVTGDVASDHYHRYEEDFAMMEAGRQNSYRFSLSWPRILPEGTGEVNRAGLDFYHAMIDSMIAHGLEPNLTLYHWDLPQALQEKGGWENIETACAYAEFAKVCFREFGGKVKIWVTINEPKYSLFSMYAAGNYPPNVKDGQRLLVACYNTMLASALAAIAFRTFENIGQIGVVSDYDPVYGVDDSPETKRAMRLADHLFNNWVTDTAMKGWFPQELLDELAKTYDLGFIKEEHGELFRRGVLDFLGINYYSRAYVRPYVDGASMLASNNTGKKGENLDDDGDIKRIMVVKGMFEKIMDPDGEFTDWDFEVYPEGMYLTLVELREKYGDIPIYITENGLGQREEPENGEIRDDLRVKFLDAHIRELLRAKDEGVNVRGYYVWSTFDLYSWVNGYDKRYGLVYVDFDNGNERIPKESFHWYRDFIARYEEEQR